MSLYTRLSTLFENWIEPLTPTGNARPPTSVRGFIWYFVRQAKLPFALLAVLNGLSGGFEALFFFYIGRLVDILDQSNAAAGWEGLLAEYGPELGLMLFVIVVVRLVIMFFLSLVSDQTIGRGFYNLVAWQSYTHVTRQSLSFFTNRATGSVMTKVGQASTSLGDFVTSVLSTIWSILIFALTTLILFFQLDISLALVVIAWIAIVFLLARYFLPRLRRQAVIVAETKADMSGRIVDVYSNIQTMKLFGNADENDDYMRGGFSAFLQATRTMGRLSIAMRSFMTLGASIAFASIAALCVQLWGTGAITVGAVAFSLALVLRLNMWLGRLLGGINHLMRNFGVLQNSMETVSEPLEIVDKPGAKPLETNKGRITFENVAFSYLPRREVVEDFSLDIAPGEKIGLVGRSGAGKTTITNLLLRFYDLQAGRILIDGQSIADVTQESLRQSIGMVTQEAAMLNRSVRDNILYGRGDATLDEVIAAAKKAEAHEFIPDLRDNKGRTGYDAFVGERGVKLSGGQRQRIAIARVMLKNAPILVLDEATSALDSEIEAAIQTHLAELMRGKTVIAIAHRLSTIAAMDRLVVIDQGRIIEQGSHADLLARKGAYAKLWARQSGGFLQVGSSTD